MNGAAGARNGRQGPLRNPLQISGGGGIRNRYLDAHETLENRPDHASEAENESPRLNTSRTESTRVDTALGTEPSEAELERGILDAMRIGLVDVARTLAARLEARRTTGNVVDFTVERAKRQ